MRLWSTSVVSIAKVCGRTRCIGNEFMLAYDMRFASRQNARSASLRSATDGPILSSLPISKAQSAASPAYASSVWQFRFNQAAPPFKVVEFVGGYRMHQTRHLTLEVVSELCQECSANPAKVSP
jgi:hypothetical protein